MSFRSFLTNVVKREQIAKTPEQRKNLAEAFTRLFEKLENIEGLSDDFKLDVEQALVGVCDLADTIVEPQYALDELLHAIVVLQAGLTTLLDHARRTRPRVVGYGIKNSTSQQLLPGFFFTSAGEASAMAANLNTLSPAVAYIVVETEQVCRYIAQPTSYILPSHGEPKWTTQPTDPLPQILQPKSP